MAGAPDHLVCFPQMRVADGRIAAGPIASCEIQGYVYDAKLRGARLAREHWSDAVLAERLEREAAEPRQRLDRDFWLPERGCYALGLDGEKAPVGRRGGADCIRDARGGDVHPLPPAGGLRWLPAQPHRLPRRVPDRVEPAGRATATPRLLLRVLLGLEAEREELAVDSYFGDPIDRITLKGIRGRWGKADAAGTRMEEALA
jgi:hypothetical protein